RRRHTISKRDWSSDVCSSDLGQYVADERTLAELEAEGRVVFRYTAGATHGPAGFESNPNGSRNDIAGITNAEGNVVGLMPHPEHAVETGFGPDQPGEGTRTGTDGLAMFTSVLRSMVSCPPGPHAPIAATHPSPRPPRRAPRGTHAPAIVRCAPVRTSHTGAQRTV